MFGPDIGPLRPLVRVQVRSVEVEPVFSGEKAERFFDIGAKFVRRPGFAGIVSGNRQTASQLAAGIFEPADVVALPTVETDGQSRQGLDRLLGVDALLRIPFSGESIGFIDGTVLHFDPPTLLTRFSILCNRLTKVKPRGDVYKGP
jgi:hypothetical protein